MKNYLKIIPFFISFFLLIHHYYKHKNDSDLNFRQKIFQIEDIDNHETWILFLLGLGIGINIKI
tara:strand:- start:346 stop:537 length:192 start_codon:yes stop_codon:yes gene_type:complete